METYIDSNLSSNERIIQRAKVSYYSQIGKFALAVFFIFLFIGNNKLIFLLALSVLLLVSAFLNIFTTELAFTNKKVIAKTGFIRRDTVELKLDRVEALMVNQSILGRIFNFGTITVSGTGGIKTPIPYISNPIYFRNVFNEYIDNPSLLENT